MNIIFFGTSTFAVPSLKAIHQSAHTILAVVTQPDRKRGRHLRVTPSPIKEIATGLDLPVYQPADASDAKATAYLKKFDADLFVVVSFGQILSQEALSIPRRFAVNLHASLLPLYRGAAPINWAIINGERATGVTVFKLAKQMDAGDIILQGSVSVEDRDTAVTLSEKISHDGADILLRALDAIAQDKASFTRQEERAATYAPRLKKSDGIIRWDIPAERIRNMVRGLLPWPSAFTTYKGKMLKILEAGDSDCDSEGAQCGQIVRVDSAAGILVKTKDRCLVIQRLQLEGGRPMNFDEFVRGHRIMAGAVLGAGR